MAAAPECWRRSPRGLLLNLLLLLLLTISHSSLTYGFYQKKMELNGQDANLPYSGPLYLQWQREPLHCAGVSHQKWSFVAFMVEAVALNRTAVIPDTFCLHKIHTHEKTHLARPLDHLVNVAELQKIPGLALVYASELPTLLTRSQLSGAMHTGAPFSSAELLVNRKEVLIVRDKWKQNDYWFNQKSAWATGKCGNVVRKMIFRGCYGLTATTAPIAHEMLKVLGPGYCALHVRRGDKARGRPQLAADTTGSAIAANATLRTIFDQCTSLYIATDERDMNVFQPIFAKYKTATLRNFTMPTSFTAYDKTIIDYHLAANPNKDATGNDLIALNIPTFCSSFQTKGYALAGAAAKLNGALCLTNGKK